MKMRKILASVVASVIACSAMAVVAAADDYNGYLSIQTNSWSYRNSWTDSGAGLGTEYFDHVENPDEGNQGGTFTDVKITGNGTYSVKLDGTFTLSGDGYNMIQVGTDIPIVEDETVTFTDVELIIDGTSVVKVAEGMTEPTKKDNVEYYVLDVINTWNDDWKAADWANFTAPIATQSIEVKFTVAFGDAEGDDEKGEDDKKDNTSSKTDDTKKDDTKKNPTTGATAGLALAGLALAGAAIVATKKND